MEKKEISKLNIIAKKVLTLLPKILYDLLIIFCVVLTVIIVFQKITDANQSFYGLRIFRVVSGSMVPKYDVGEVVICQDIAPKEIALGDVIVYRGNVGELNNRLVMHEVVDINSDENGYLTFHVKGIQNTAGDPDVKENQVLGKVVFKSGLLTLLYSLATSMYSSFIIITVLVINVFVAFRPIKKPKELEESTEKENTESEQNGEKESKTDEEKIQHNSEKEETIETEELKEIDSDIEEKAEIEKINKKVLKEKNKEQEENKADKIDEIEVKETDKNINNEKDNDLEEKEISEKQDEKNQSNSLKTNKDSKAKKENIEKTKNNKLEEKKSRKNKKE